MTKEEFKELWETSESGITWDLLANLAKEWSIAEKPRCMDSMTIRYRVLKAANTSDAEDYNPDYLEHLECIQNA